MTTDEKTLDSLEMVDRMKVLDLQPDDVIIVESDDCLSRDQCKRIEEVVGSVLKGHKVLVCDSSIRIKAARVAG